MALCNACKRKLYESAYVLLQSGKGCLAICAATIQAAAVWDNGMCCLLQHGSQLQQHVVLELGAGGVMLT